MPNKVIQLASKIRRIVQRRPEVKYSPPDKSNNTCYYDRGNCTDGTVGCIVGQALAIMGVPAEDLKRVMDARSMISSCFPIDTDDLDMKGRGEELSWISKVQEGQDAGLTWGEAVQEADKIYGIG